MTFRSHHAALALACFAMTAASSAIAGDAKAPIVLEGKSLRADAAGALVKPIGQLKPEFPITFEMRGRVRGDGSVELLCTEAGHGPTRPHEHRDGRGEEIR